MGKTKQKKSNYLDRLKNKYRLVILNDETFEEKASFRLSRFNVYVLFSTQAIILVILTYLLIAFTPLREYIPGYGDVDTAKKQLELEASIDSLSIELGRYVAWQNNISNILSGDVDTSTGELIQSDINYDSIKLDVVPDEDLQLREEIEREENYALINDGGIKKKKSISQLSFFPPIKGYITQQYKPNTDHFGVDVVAPEGEPIKAVLDGTVILSEWTLETGYVIGIQHDYDLISFYKHNSVLLKKVGNFVKAGDAIAIIGSSGELTTGHISTLNCGMKGHRLTRKITWYSKIRNMAMFGKSNGEENGSKVKQGGNLHNHFGEGTVIQGEVKSPSNIRIDGIIKGTVQSEARIIIGANGKVIGDVICENADISGKVEGTVNAKDLLQLTRTAVIDGDIACNKLVVEAGAVFNGSSTMNESKTGAKRLNETKDDKEETYQKQAV